MLSPYRKLKLNGHTVYEHRVVMERKLGRQLLRTEQVHHRNRVKKDLAAHERNHVAPIWYGPGSFFFQDSLKPNCQWRQLEGLLWLNPPFGDIEPWAHKCSIEAHYGARIALLTPASIGSAWFARHVHEQALVLGLTGRLNFDGKAPYPKDLMLSLFDRHVEPGFGVWDWRKPWRDAA